MARGMASLFWDIAEDPECQQTYREYNQDQHTGNADAPQITIVVAVKIRIVGKRK